MATDKEMIKTLFKIASRQQKIIEKLAQQVAGTPATLEDFNALLQSIMLKSGRKSTGKVTYVESGSDGTYDIKMVGSVQTTEMAEFKQQAASKWTEGDVNKLRIQREMVM